jgi:sulfonate transport system substrate-binding protein
MTVETRPVMTATHRHAFLASRLAAFLALCALVVVAVLASSCRKPANRPEVVHIDFAYYNPISLLLKDKGWLEQDLMKDGIRVDWTQSAGSNKALELLNAKSLDFGSTAGAAALLGRANGNPIKSILVYSKPEWTALVTTAQSGVHEVKDLRGKKIAATRGTDPHIFLLRALDANGMSEKDIELVPLQHADGKAALERGDVSAWAGLDPLMAQAQQSGFVLFFRRPAWNTYGVLNVREEFAAAYPNVVRRVAAAYERARLWAIDHPDELEAVLVRNAKISDSVARAVLRRTDLSNSTLGDAQRESILAAGDVLEKSGVVKPETDVRAVAAALIDPSFAPASSTGAGSAAP